MLLLLYSLPDLAVAFLFGGVAALLFGMAPLVRLRLFGPISDANSEIARATMITITGFTGAVLAFSLVQAQSNLRSAEGDVINEGIQFNQMDRLLTRYGDPDVAAIRKLLHAYAQSVVTDEWPQLARHSTSPATSELFSELSQAVLAIKPAVGRQNVLFADLVKVADQMAESREQRIYATSLGLPAIFWEVIGTLMLLLVVFAGFVEPRRGRVISLAGLGAGLALLVTLVFVFDQPFLGNVSVTPSAIERALQVMDARVR